MPATTCPRCSEPWHKGETSCGHCGTQIRICSVCAGLVAQGDRFCGQCGTSQDGDAPLAAPSAPEPSPWDEVLQRLRQATSGDFIVHRELGRGGMAAVYLAHDIALNRKVAIKVMAPGLLMGPGMVERFRQEAVTVANLSHPHIVTIHAVRQVAGLHFFVMKLIPGRSLERIIHEGGPIPIPLAQAILFQVGSALSHAHRRGVVHRDVKPANILMDEDGNAIVTDFGIAKVRESPSHTMTGATVGTPAYMSPEQCWSREVTDSSDQYSLGIVAYEMLTGGPPFVGPTLGILRAHVEDSPKPLAEVRADCPGDVAAAVERMLAKEPRNRWADIMQAVTALGGRHLPENDPLREELAALAMKRAGAVQQALPTPSPIPITGPPPPSRSSPLTALVVSASRSSAPVGETVQVHASGQDATGVSMPGARITWTSSDPTVATVSVSGVVTPLSPGTVTITAGGDGGVNGVTILEVTPPAPATAEVSGAPGELGVGESAALGLVVRDARGQPLPPRGVRWTSSNAAVASVTPSGAVRAMAPGTVTLTAVADGDVTAAAIIVVRPPPVVSLAVSGGPQTWHPGDRVRLIASARDGFGAVQADRQVRWTSDAPDVAAVGEDGTVTASREGVARITAMCEGRSATTEVRVDPAPVAAVVVQASSRPLKVGRRATLRAEPQDAGGRKLRGRTVAWSSLDSAIAEIDAQTGVVRGLSPGSVGIIATCEEVRGETTLQVTPAPTPAQRRRLWWAAGIAVIVALGAWLWPRGGGGEKDGPKVAALALAPASGELQVGDTVRLAATVRAADGSTLAPPPILWRSSDSSIVAVSTEGVISAVGPGSATVTAVGAGQEARAAFQVLARSITGGGTILLSGAPPKVVVRDTFSLTARVLDGAGAEAGDAPVEWRSSRPAVASVSETGQVVALAEGSTTITAKNGDRLASLAIRVGGLPVGSIAVAPATRTLNVGDSIRMTATILSPSGDTLRGKVAVWSSDAPGVVTVSPAGLVVAVSRGRATITVTSGGVRGQALLTTVGGRLPVTAVEIQPISGTLEVGATITLKATVRGAGAVVLKDRPISWRSSQPQIATVAEQTGAVTARAAGQAQITATSEAVNGTVTVNVAPRPTGPGGETGAARYQSIAVGGFSCGVGEDGTTTCWGLGNTRPTGVGGPRLRLVTVGLGFACGLTAAGQAYCWGANGKGQLGDGSTRNRGAPGLVTADLTFTTVAAGEVHACGLTSGGNVYCWGSNGDGQLGDGSKDDRSRPTQIRETQPWRLVVAGGKHSCALNTQGKAYCWGDGFSGELGQGMTESSLDPVPVEGGLTFTSITAGRRHTCGLTSSRQVYCWGDNRDGQLGNGGREDVNRPVRVASNDSFEAVSASASHTCAVSAGGYLLCWGANGSGQLGIGEGSGRLSPIRVKAEQVFTDVRAGTSHTCALSRDKQALCWGGNTRGQLGDGTEKSRAVPGPVRR